MVNIGHSEVEGMLRSTLDESRVAVAVRAIDAVLDDYIRMAVGSRYLSEDVPAAVERALQAGVPAAVLQRCLWLAHLRLLDHRLNAAGGRVRTEDLTSFTIRYCGRITRAYAGPAPYEVLRRLLTGGSTDEPQAERVLQVRFTDHHWAAVLRLAPGSSRTVEDMVRFTLTVARTVGGARPLVAVNNSGEVWMWTHWPSAPSPHRISAACDRLTVPAGIRIGIGPVGSGIVGFRRSFLAARAACKSAGAAPDRGWRNYYDASSVSLLGGDEQQTRWFVDEVLGELGRDEPWHAMLRETLRLYLVHGRSRQQVADALYINRNTVAYRVKKATQMLGRPFGDDTFDLRLALELSRTTTALPA